MHGALGIEGFNYYRKYKNKRNKSLIFWYELPEIRQRAYDMTELYDYNLKLCTANI